MSRKHFELIARNIAAAPMCRADRLKIAAQFADSLRSENPRFDRLRFMEACGC